MFSFLNSPLQEILNSTPSPYQIRNLKNEIIASNELGFSFFGKEKDPFFLLQQSSDRKKCEDLFCAYNQQTSFNTYLSLSNKVYLIEIIKSPSLLILKATEETSSQVLIENLTHQLKFIESVLSLFPHPLYISSKEGKILYANQSFYKKIAPVNSVLDKSISDFLLENHSNPSSSWEGVCLFQQNTSSIPVQISQYPFVVNHHSFICGVLYPYEESSSVSYLFDNCPLSCVLIDVLNKQIKHKNISFNQLITELSELSIPNSFMDLLTETSQETLSLKLTEMLQNSLSYDRIDLTTSLDFGNKTFTVFIGWGSPQKDTFILYFLDASERKNLEIQVAHSQKMQAMGQLAGGVAHDFNNLLTAIIGFSDLIISKNPEESFFSDLIQIKSNAQKAASLVGQLLTFSRKQPIKLQTLSVHDAFIDLSALLQRSLAPFITLQIDCKKNLGYIKIDQNQLTQIFLNLAINAKDAMANGGIFKIATSYEKIKKTKPCGTDTICPGDYIKIIVSDTGTGISSENLPRIFEPFFTTKEPSHASGTGLGLSTVYGIIRTVNGFISVDSEKGIGTTFTIYLPRFEKEKQISENISPIRSMISGSTQHKILLVDDETGVRIVSARALKNKGYSVIECGNAEQALVYLKEHSDIDLLITDMVMPGMNGEVLTQEAHLLFPHLKTILISGYSEEFSRHGTASDLGFSFLAKPFNLEQLITKVQEILK